MKKKVVGILLTLALTLSLVACGGDSKTDTTTAPAKETEKATEAAKEDTKETEKATEAGTQAAETKAEEGNAEGKTETEKINPTGTKYKIALSNSFMGNDWRQQMERVVEYVATQEPYASRCELTIVNCENDAESQSASIDALVQQGYDAILVDPASETGVNQAIQRACDAGITVVVFDQPASVSTDKCWHIRFDGARNYSILAKWMAEAIGGEGNVVLDQGLQGAAEAELEYNASKEMFETYPGINIVSDYQSNYGLSEGEQALASVIAANPDIDAVTTQGYCGSVINAFKKAGLDIPVSCGGGYNGNMKALLENNAEGIIDVYYVGLSADALNYAIRILDGEEMPEETVLDVAFVATSVDYDMGEYSDVKIELAEEGKNFFNDQPDELIYPAVGSNFGIDIPLEVITGE
ncbi:MAG: substrate-binding domain-containing protein [Lachnospiraceae bacterium]|nr:substrate-binding domain-containing protein [Lachnospiraceae bacterium]